MSRPSRSSRPYEHGTSTGARRLPEWLRRPMARTGDFRETESLLEDLHLNTVCSGAKCPNRGECFSSGTATFLVLGDACTRRCGFCAVDHAEPAAPDPDEPRRVAEAASRMGLEHVVVTMVTRDDLEDGGAAHVRAVIEALREALPEAAVEVLVSDFAGDLDAVDVVTAAGPDVFNHNLETVPRLYELVRPGADYARSLSVLARAREARCAVPAPGMPTKSGLMLGLGETRAEVHAVMADLREVGVTMLTLGQYLRPTPAHLPVAEFIEPAVFTGLCREAYRAGFTAVASAPFVRSSYHAQEMEAERRAAPAR